jgi:ECF transporter S component (folate family)
MSSFTGCCKGGIFIMTKLKQTFRDSFHELKDVKALAMTAMLLAIAVVLGFYSLQVTDFIKISFAFLADEMTGMLFGPVVGGIMGGAADLVKYLVRPTGPFFPGFTVSGAASGLIYGMVLYKQPLTIRRTALANALVMLLVNIGLNTYWLTLLYGDAFFAILPARLIKQAVMFPINVALFYGVAKILGKARLFTTIRGQGAL